MDRLADMGRGGGRGGGLWDEVEDGGMRWRMVGRGGGRGGGRWDTNHRLHLLTSEKYFYSVEVLGGWSSVSLWVEGCSLFGGWGRSCPSESLLVNPD